MATEVSRRASSALGGGEVADGGRQHGHQRGAKHQVPQQAVHHIVAIPLFIQIERNTGVLKAQGDHRQRAADQQEAQAAQRSGEFAVVKIIEHDQRHNQRHNQPDAHQVVAHRLRHAATRPAEVGDKQPVWPGEVVAEIITTHSRGTVAVTPSPIATASGNGRADCRP